MRAKKNLEAANNELEVNLDNALKVTTSLNHCLVPFFSFLFTVFVFVFLILRICFNPLSSKLNIQFLNKASIHFLKKWLRELVKRSRHIFFSDFFIISHYLSTWLYTDYLLIIIWRKLMLVTLSPVQTGASTLNNVASVCTGLKVWPVSNFAQQHPTTCNRVCKRTQHVTSNNVGSCWSTMLRPFARSLRDWKS